MIKVGVALGSGGPKGLAHIGVLKVLEENNIPIDYIAGSSIGSLIGGFYAAKKNALEVEKIAVEMSKFQTISLFVDPSLKNGFVAGEKLSQFIEKNIGKVDFNDLKIPFCAVATNLKTNKTYLFDKGNVTAAIKASCSVPYVFRPISHNEQTLVDGSLTMPIPVEAVKKMGANIIIAVNLYYDICQTQFSSSPKASLMSFIILNSLSIENTKNANIVINPKIGHISWKSLLSKEEKNAAIRLGEEAMKEKLPELKKLLKAKENIFDKIKNFFIRHSKT